MCPYNTVCVVAVVGCNRGSHDPMTSSVVMVTQWLHGNARVSIATMALPPPHNWLSTGTYPTTGVPDSPCLSKTCIILACIFQFLVVCQYVYASLGFMSTYLSCLWTKGVAVSRGYDTYFSERLVMGYANYYILSLYAFLLLKSYQKCTNPAYQHSYFCKQKWTTPPAVPIGPWYTKSGTWNAEEDSDLEEHGTDKLKKPPPPSAGA